MIYSFNEYDGKKLKKSKICEKMKRKASTPKMRVGICKREKVEGLTVQKPI